MGRPSKIKHSSPDLDSPTDIKMPRLNMENISASFARDIAGSLPSHGDGGYHPENIQISHSAPGMPSSMNSSGMKHFAKPSQMSPVRMQNYTATSSAHQHFQKQMKPSFESHNRSEAGPPTLQQQSGMQSSPLQEYSPDMSSVNYTDTSGCNPSPQSEDMSRASPFSDCPISPPSVQQPRSNPIPFNLFPAPSPGSDVRFHGPAGPQKVEPDSVNAAHLIRQIISQNTQENEKAAVDLGDDLAPTTSGAVRRPEQGHSTLESVAPALPMQLTFQNIKQEFARAALSMYPPATPIKPAISTAPASTVSINSPTSDCVPSPDTTSAASPMCTTSPVQEHMGNTPSSSVPAISTSSETPSTAASPESVLGVGSSERQPYPVSTSVLSSLVELSEHLQGLSQGQGLIRMKKEGTQGHENSDKSLVLADFNDGFHELNFRLCVNYWLRPELPDENLLFSEDHWRIIDQIMPAYNRFVETGSSINRKLRNEVEVTIDAYI